MRSSHRPGWFSWTASDSTSKHQHMNEVWAEIPGMEHYLVSSKGVILNTTSGLYLKPRYRGGYVRFILYDSNHNTKQVSAHRLVAELFIPNPEGKPHIDHINGIRDDNRVENLRWVFPNENARNPITRQRQRDGLKGHIVSKECREKISIANTGKKRSAETRQKLHDLGIGRTPANKGVPMTAASKEKLSKSLKEGYQSGRIKPTCTKPVELCDSDGTIISRWKSAKDAAHDTGSTRSNICWHLKNNKPLRDGKIWKYIEEGK